MHAAAHMRKMKVLTIVGTRPNFMKAAPLVREFERRGVVHVLVHTGQHYDKKMSDLFFSDLLMPKPDVNLGIASSTFAEQVVGIMHALRPVLLDKKPDVVVVVGDVTSTFASALCAKECGIAVAHVEAGLRSHDWGMPEEINRVLTDKISDYLFLTEESAKENLQKEGIDAAKAHFVGNVMIDTLLAHKEKAQSSTIRSLLGIEGEQYCVLTLHRPSNVDSKDSLSHTLDIVGALQKHAKMVFPIHPRTQKNIERHGLKEKLDSMKNVIVTEPLGYLDFLCLLSHSALIITDSGGIQEEATVLGIPCITMRDNTERPITTTHGTNIMVSTNKERIVNATMQALKGEKISHRIPPLWDGKAAQRVVNILLENHHGK